MMVKVILEGSIGSSKACGNYRPLVIDLDMGEIFYFHVFKFLKYLLIYWLHWVLVAACGIFRMQTLVVACRI